jgi:menaquinone-dependent protoporphyrinogen oxidase
MKILVATESKHGATDEIGQAIAEVLREQGFDADARRFVDVPEDLAYDAFVLGSAIYLGSWLAPARAFVEQHRELLATRPTWLFSSGPGSRASGDPSEAPRENHRLLELTGARDHHVFGGRLDSSQLGLGERLVARLARVPEGDFREWEAVVAWATAIGRTLAESPHGRAGKKLTSALEVE